MRRTTSTSVSNVTPSCSSIAIIKTRTEDRRANARLDIAACRRFDRLARPKPTAARAPKFAKLPAKDNNTSARLPGTVPRPANMTSRLGSDRKPRCCLPTSSTFSGWDGSSYEAHVAQVTHYASPPTPITSALWQRSFPRCGRHEKPD